jgi:hypothetical protein
MPGKQTYFWDSKNVGDVLTSQGLAMSVTYLHKFIQCQILDTLDTLVTLDTVDSVDTSGGYGGHSGYSGHSGHIG